MRSSNLRRQTASSVRPGKEAISARVFWDLDRRLEDLDRDGIDRQVLIFHSAHVFYDADTRVAIQAARRYNDALAETIAACKDPSRYLGAASELLWNLLPRPAARSGMRY